MSKLAIIGSLDLATQIQNLAISCGHSIVGFYDDFITTSASSEKIILGSLDQVLLHYQEKKFESLIVAVGYKHLKFRHEVFHKFHSMDIPFATLIHPSATIDKMTNIGQGSVIFAGCILDKNVRVGNNVLLNHGCIIAHDTTISDSSFLGPRVTLAGNCHIGYRCFLGVSTTCIDSCTICDDVHSGGGSVFVKSVVEPGLYLGVPAKKSKKD